MVSAVQRIKLSSSRDISINKLVVSQSNVRRVKAGVSIEQLVESVAQCSLLQSLSVRAVVDTDGQETGLFEVPAGGRRYRALELLSKQRRMAKTQPIPCVLSIAEDDKTILDLADGLQVRRVRVTGANRIELTGFADTMRDRLRACGLCGEIISWKLRSFVLAKVLGCYPIARVGDRAAA
jgi:ParB-like chromosome segregation protein Spo0J